MPRTFAVLFTALFALGIVFASPVRIELNESPAIGGSGIATTVSDESLSESKPREDAREVDLMDNYSAEGEWDFSDDNVVRKVGHEVLAEVIEARSPEWDFDPISIIDDPSVSCPSIWHWYGFIALWH